MNDQTFDPNTLIAAAREAFAPVLKAQQEGFKTLERLARLQYAVAGDVLESGLARVNATFVRARRASFSASRASSTASSSTKLRARAEEFATVTSEIQTKLTPARQRDGLRRQCPPARRPDILAVSRTRGRQRPRVRSLWRPP